MDDVKVEAVSEKYLQISSSADCELTNVYDSTNQFAANLGSI